MKILLETIKLAIIMSLFIQGIAFIAIAFMQEPPNQSEIEPL
jgi:hypothetical protein